MTMSEASRPTAGGVHVADAASEEKRVDELQAALDTLPRPLLILSTAVGRGMHSIGEALAERGAGRGELVHRTVEEFLPAQGLREDVERYRAISSRLPLLLHLPYRFAPIYHRKLLRERHFATTDVSSLSSCLIECSFRSVLAVSHRPAFWAGIAKERASLTVPIIGLSGEYGSSLGWRFVPWSALEGFLSPVPRAALRFEIPEHVTFREVALPARRAYVELATKPGRRDAVLIVCGFWGQGRIDRIVRELLDARPELELHAVCGENERMRRQIAAVTGGRVHAYGVVPSLAPLIERCASVISKPGIATILEAHAARRKLFLVRGMPVAEDNNLRFACEWLGAVRYSLRSFLAWHAIGPDQPAPT
jgi:hypothetical protein